MKVRIPVLSMVTFLRVSCAGVLLPGIAGGVALQPNEGYGATYSWASTDDVSGQDVGYLGDPNRFIWSYVETPQIAEQSFDVVIVALDVSNYVAISFNGTVTLSSETASVSPGVSGQFTNGVWLGSIAVLQRATNVVLRADDGGGHFGISNPFDVGPAKMAPVILSQPTNRLVVIEDNVTFEVTADGTPPLSYQWAHNGTNLDGATNPTLTLTNALWEQAGVYIVLVTNAYGAVLSSNATLAVVGVPAITRINPLRGTLGSSVTISGTNFSPIASNNIVYFGAVRAPVILAEETNLTVTVPSGATYAPITVTVNRRVAYGNTFFQPTFVGDGSQISTSSFESRFDLPAGNGANRTVIADMDGDGKPDLVLANETTGSVSLFRNIGTNGPLSTNSFAPRLDIALKGGHIPRRLDVADVDADGKLDLVISDKVHNLVDVLRNTSAAGELSTNSLAAPVTLVVGASPEGVRVRDLDGDGRPDLVVACGGANTLQVFPNRGGADITTNTFGPPVVLATGTQPYDVAIADLDGDGKPDIAQVNYTPSFVSIFRNVSVPGMISTNSFEPRVDIPAAGEGNSIGVGDIDGDGKPDITVGWAIGSAVSVYRNLANPGSIDTNSFAPRVDLAEPGMVRGLAVGDLDGDGRPDLSVVCEVSSSMSVFQNTSGLDSISFAGRVDFGTGWNPQGVSIGDLNGDGRPDIAFANRYDFTVSIYENKAPFGVPPSIALQPASRTILGGSDVTFTVIANGTAPMHYSWQKNGSPLSGATNASLTLPNVARSNSATYNVVITNVAGCVTSSNALLVVHVPQRLGLPVLLPDGTVVFSSSDLDGGTLAPGDLDNFTTQVSSNLLDWVQLPGVLTLTNGVLQLHDTDLTGRPARFYRIVESW